MKVVKKLRYIAILLSILFFACAMQQGLSNHQNLALPRLFLQIEINDIAQKDLADSLLFKLAKRLEVYSTEYERFTLAHSHDSTDLTLKIKLTNLYIVSNENQSNIEAKRKRLEKRTDAIIDSLDKNLGPKIVADNIAANVVANAVLMPFGFAAVIVIHEEINTARIEDKMLSSTYTCSSLGYEVHLVNKKNKIIWSDKNTESFHMRYNATEKEQEYLLVRNAVMRFEENLPLFRQAWKCGSCICQ